MAVKEILVLGHVVKVTEEKVCKRSGDDHIKLKHEARADRELRGFDRDQSFVLCGRCGEAVPLG
jgi:hypothetical protein